MGEVSKQGKELKELPKTINKMLEKVPKDLRPKTDVLL